MNGLTSYYYYEDRVITPATHQYRVYHADEADKVIEELKHQRDGAFGLANLGLTLDDLSQTAKKETDHQKYKRCVAMASYWVAVSYQCVDDKHRRSAERHRGKWLALANKFKEAK